MTQHSNSPTMLGLLLWELIRPFVHLQPGDLLICTTIFAVMLSPITALNALLAVAPQNTGDCYLSAW